MKFSRVAFNRHLNNMGQKVLWRQSFACSCMDPTNGAPDPKCKLCVGKGRIWEPPVETVTGIASQKTVVQWANLGLYEAGDMVLSIPENSPLWDAGQFDRVTMLNGTDVFSMALIHGAPSERLSFVPQAITRVFWKHPQTGAMVKGGIPTVGASGRLTWTTGEPPAGVGYSISGTRNSEYFMLGELPSNRNEHQGMRLPKRVVLRKWDLFGRAARTPG